MADIWIFTNLNSGDVFIVCLMMCVIGMFAWLSIIAIAACIAGIFIKEK